MKIQLPRRRTLLLAALPLLFLAPPGRATGRHDDRYLFEIDSIRTAVQYDIETNLGPCTIVGGDDGTLSGELELTLRAGLIPIETGRFDGGHCTCLPNVLAVIPNTIPGLPPLLEIDLETLTLAPNSPDFLVVNGAFMTDSICDVVDGSLVVRVLGQLPCTVPIIGMTSDSARTSGRIDVDGNGIHVRREIGNTLRIDVPALGIDITIRIRGQIEADLRFPIGDRFCNATDNSTGHPARIDFDGTTSLTMNDGVLSVSDCPSNRLGFFFYGPDEGPPAPFGNGNRCVFGSLHRLPAFFTAPDGTGVFALDLTGPQTSQYLEPGTTWGFQFVFRDGAAGGARFNASDAIRLRFVP